ncbi:MAG TPA: DUF4244 domain-containing protein [Aeromicrobium sp.]|nr:DUF4244 domain-containing protein [Aeromicrobium sp.]
MSTKLRTQKQEQGQVTAEYTVGTLGAVVIAGILIGPLVRYDNFLRDWMREMLSKAFEIDLSLLSWWPW